MSDDTPTPVENKVPDSLPQDFTFPAAKHKFTVVLGENSYEITSDSGSPTELLARLFLLDPQDSRSVPRTIVKREEDAEAVTFFHFAEAVINLQPADVEAIVNGWIDDDDEEEEEEEEIEERPKRKPRKPW